MNELKPVRQTRMGAIVYDAAAATLYHVNESSRTKRLKNQRCVVKHTPRHMKSPLPKNEKKRMRKYLRLWERLQAQVAQLLPVESKETV